MGRFVVLATITLAASIAPTSASAVQRIGERVAVITVEGANCVAVAGSDGIAVIDTGPGPASGLEVRRTAETLFPDVELAVVVSTHCHWDHVDGNQAFADVARVAHASCPEAMRRAFEDRARASEASAPRDADLPPPPPPGVTLPPPDGGAPRAVAVAGEGQQMATTLRERFQSVELTPPTSTFTVRRTIDLGDRTLELIPYGGGHSTCDVLVVVPEERLLVSGDLFLHGQLPLVTGNGTPAPAEWLAALDELDALGEPAWVVPGHGELVEPDELRWFARYVRWLVAATRDASPVAVGDPLPLELGLDEAPAPPPTLDPAAAEVHRANVAVLTALSPSSGG